MKIWQRGPLALGVVMALCGQTASAQQNPPQDAVSEARLRADIDTLVGFGTRHTLSVQDDPRRGIGAARRWAEAEFRRIGRGCRNCLTIALPERMVMGARVPVPTRLVNVLAIQRGTERRNEVVIIAGHIDSRVTDVMNATADAPGANDDGSGTAAVIEAARVLSRHHYPTTIVYAVLSGEEQGLLGGQLLADYARDQGWTVKAVLNNDIIGGTRGADGVIDETVRIFSEGPRADADDALRARARREGGDNDSPSRNLSRWLDALAERSGIGIDVRQIWRADRFGRGGDHLPSLDAGFPAVRFSVGIEDYNHQHQDLRTESGVTFGDTAAFMDFPYLARVTRLNVAALDTLARAPMPPAPGVEGAVSTDTTLHWDAVAGAVRYRVYRRATTDRDWQLVKETAEPATAASQVIAHDDAGNPLTVNHPARFRVVMSGVRVDDWVFGVSSVAADGSESPVASAVPGGAFGPLSPSQAPKS